jgi:hypothetical protein
VTRWPTASSRRMSWDGASGVPNRVIYVSRARHRHG